MKNIKKIAFYSILSLSILKMSCKGEHMFERAAKILGDSGIEATKIAADAGLEATRLTTQAALDATKLTAEAGKIVGENAVTVSEKAIKASEKFGSEAAKVLAPVAGVAVIIYGASTVVDMGARLYDYNNPDEEKKARLSQAREINDYIGAKRAFRTCLKNNLKTTQRNASGIPTSCEDLANMFAIAAGSRTELDEMTEVFKSLYQ